MNALGMLNDSCQDYVNRLQQVVSRANNLGVVGGGDDGDDDGRWVNQWGKQVGSIQYQNGNQSLHKNAFCSHHTTPHFFFLFLSPHP